MPFLTKRLLLRIGFILVSGLVLYIISSSINETTHHDNTQSRSSDSSSSKSTNDQRVNKWSIPSIPNGMKGIFRGNQAYNKKLNEYERDEYDSGGGKDGWVDLDKELLVTRYEGGVPGYQVFSNLYLVNSVLTSVIPSSSSSTTTDDQLIAVQDKFTSGRDNDNNDDDDEREQISTQKAFPNVKHILSSEKRGIQADEDRWKLVDQNVGREEIGKKGYKLGGVTYIFNDPPGPDGYLIYFRHFVLEAFLGATRILASTLAVDQDLSIPKRIWFPRCGSEPSWRDDRGENAWFLAHALPSATVEDKNGWDDRNTAGLPILLEKVVIVDRWAAHSSGGEVGKWGKMNALIPSTSATKSFWQPIRSNVIRSLGVDGSSEIGSTGLPVVVYVDRQKESPKMKQSDHDAMVEGLMSLTNIAEVHVARISAMSKARQVEITSKAQVIVSLHGDELFTALWMPSIENSLVIELFEEGGFIRDFELLATSLNHRYIAVSGNKVLTEEEWRETGATKGVERDKGEISINTELVIRLIEESLESNTRA
ncbi:uncharacterized protein L201_001522 [Kwoniella dendrophila CBS 6074]|uniref:Uncharacterized protein n=1 Tax=Kwoniella dendrophila CBS 6074 TaxID=1295534 RepID=A0AAX4JQ30_9TREE